MKSTKCFLLSNIKTIFTNVIIYVIIKQKGKKEDIALVFFDFFIYLKRSLQWTLSNFTLTIGSLIIRDNVVIFSCST